VEGAATIFVALIAFFSLLPLPQNMKPSRGFSAREIMIAQKRLLRDKVDNGAGNDVSPWQALLMNLKSYRIILLIIGYMVIVGSSTLSYFYPTLVGGLGYEGATIQYMTIPIYAAAFVVNLFVAYFSDRFIRARGYILTGLLCAAGVFSVVVVTCYGYTTRYAMLCLMASALWAANALALSYSATTLSDKDSKTRGVGLALINALGNLAQIYGSYLFPSDDKPKYLMGFGVITGMCFLGMFTYLLLALYVQKQFKALDLAEAERDEELAKEI
jgi:MFS family permease